MNVASVCCSGPTLVAAGLLKLICFKGQRVVDSEMAFVLAVVEMSGYLSYCSTASLL